MSLCLSLSGQIVFLSVLMNFLVKQEVGMFLAFSLSHSQYLWLTTSTACQKLVVFITEGAGHSYSRQHLIGRRFVSAPESEIMSHQYFSSAFLDEKDYTCIFMCVNKYTFIFTLHLNVYVLKDSFTRQQSSVLLMVWFYNCMLLLLNTLVFWNPFKESIFWQWPSNAIVAIETNRIYVTW